MQIDDYQVTAAVRSGRLVLDELHTMYFEESGDPLGRPVVYLHGGPGAGMEPSLIEAGVAANESDLPEHDRARLADALASANIKAILTFKSDEDASGSSTESSRRMSAIHRPTPRSINVRAAAIAGDIAHAVGASL